MAYCTLNSTSTRSERPPAKRAAKKRNTVSMNQFLVDHIVYGLVGLFVYRASLFRRLGDWTLVGSEMFLFGLVVICCLIGICLTYKTKRNTISVAVNLLFPFELYTVMTYRGRFSWLLVVALVATLVIGGGYLFLLFSPQVRDREQQRLINSERRRRGFHAVRTIVVFCLAVLPASLLFSVMMGKSLVLYDVPAVSYAEESEWTMSNKIKRLSLFFEPTWQTLSLERKTAVLQVLANVECHHLGLPYELTVRVQPLLDGAEGAHDEQTHSIWVDIDHLERDDSQSVMNTVCHEAYHAYQSCLCDVYNSVDDKYKNLIDIKDAEYYMQEFYQYTHPAEGFDEYYDQVCETNARVYAEDRTAEYMSYIEEYIIREGSY